MVFARQQGKLEKKRRDYYFRYAWMASCVFMLQGVTATKTREFVPVMDDPSVDVPVTLVKAVTPNRLSVTRRRNSEIDRLAHRINTIPALQLLHPKVLGML